MARPSAVGRRSRSTAAARDAPSEAEWKKDRKYTIVIDAGSSGSRVQIYSWKDPYVQAQERLRSGLANNVLPVVEKGTWEGSLQEWQLKVEPGLSSFASNPKGIRSYLAPLFTHAVSIIPHDQWSSTPVYILATAGMRLLSQTEQDGILSETCRYLRGHVSFSSGTDPDCSENVRVISGEEEGLLGWISINYLMDGFHFRSLSKDPGQAKGQSVGKSTYGFLDMGGASTQIAFEPSSNAKQQAHDDLTPVKLRMLDGTEAVHEVFVTTFLGFGTNKARERYLDGLAVNATSSVEATLSHVDLPPHSSHDKILAPELAVPDPCLPVGFSSVLSHPSTSAVGSASQNVTIIGTGSFAGCLKAALPLLDKDAACSHPPCLFHGVHVPPIDFSVNHFIGVSEYWYSANDIFKLGGVYDFVSFQKKASEFCATPWNKLSVGSYGPAIDSLRLQQQCFKAAWMTTILHEGIGLPRLVDKDGGGDGKPHADMAVGMAENKNLFQSVNDLKGLAVSWTLGKAVEQASRNVLPAVAPAVNDAMVGVLPPADGTPGDKQAEQAPEYWHRPPDDVSHFPAKENLSRNPMPFILIMLVVAALLFWVMRRARRPRRAVLGRPLGGPSSGQRPMERMLQRFFDALKGGGRSGGGDYILANMEEGQDDFETASAAGAGKYNRGGVLSGINGDGRDAHDGSGEGSYASDSVRWTRGRRRAGDSIMSRLLNVGQTILASVGLANNNNRRDSSSSIAAVQYSRTFPPRIPSRHGTPAISPSATLGPSGTRSPPRTHVVTVKNGVTSFRPTSPSFPLISTESNGTPTGAQTPALGVSSASTSAARSLSRPTSRNALRPSISPAFSNAGGAGASTNGLSASSGASSAFSSRTASPAFGLPASSMFTQSIPVAAGSPSAYSRRGNTSR